MPSDSAAARALRRVEAVRDLPEGRRALLRTAYGHGFRGLPFARAALAFIDWQLSRGVLAPEAAAAPGSPWWRQVNEALVRDPLEARALAAGAGGEASGSAVLAHGEFLRSRTAASWYRAHNASVVHAYLAHEPLAQMEGRVERFFINLVLIRVLYAHALVANPRLALGWLAPVARLVGDPRVGMAGIFLSLSRVLPDSYPLGDDVERYVLAEHGFGHLLDVGVIQPRIRALYDWSAAELGIPDLSGLLGGDVPVYAWEADDADVWRPPVSAPARLVRRVFGQVPLGTSVTK
jgi:hypothetical protein